jgi:hypothetical protein
MRLTTAHTSEISDGDIQKRYHRAKLRFEGIEI